jgi:hypothetical protein
VILEMIVWQPFMTSTLASTAAIVFRDLDRFRRDWLLVVACYLIGFMFAVPLSLLGTALGVPAILPAAVAAIPLLVCPLGRFHPPIACVPFAVTTVPTVHGGIGHVATQWLAAAGTSVYVLGALVLIAYRLATFLSRLRPCALDSRQGMRPGPGAPGLAQRQPST